MQLYQELFLCSAFFFLPLLTSNQSGFTLLQRCLLKLSVGQPVQPSGVSILSFETRHVFDRGVT